MKRTLPIAALVIPAMISPAAAQVFEVIHPDVDQGSFKFELLQGVTTDDIEVGEERSAHEIAIGYSFFSFWATKLAVEIANPEGEPAEYEAFEWENTFVIPGLGAHAHEHGEEEHGHSHGEGLFSLGALGLFFALEVPNEGGIETGAVEIGPIAEVELGPVETVANLFFEIPFEEEEDAGLAYALQASIPVGEFGPGAFAFGFEAHGGAEGAFGDGVPIDEDSHVIGPAVFSEFDIGRGRKLEPRLAALFGLTEGSPDTTISLNLELKF